MRFQNILQELLARMQDSPADNPLRELRLLAGHVLGISYEEMLFDPPAEIEEVTVMVLRGLVNRRCRHEPLAKILGYKEFWGLKFKVTADTLDPRPDSETLIETALKYMDDHQKAIQILDLGTGSGCLLLSLLTELPNARGLGVDFSKAALAVAQENAISLHLQDRCQFIQSNWFDPVSGAFDIIISNPPYIDRSEVLSQETLYDPTTALFAEAQGLADYKIILKSARNFLKFRGLLILEIGYSQADVVTHIAQECKFNLVAKVKDFNQLNRCLVFS